MPKQAFNAKRMVNSINECWCKLSLLTLTVLGLGAYGPHKDINLKSIICRFNIRDQY